MGEKSKTVKETVSGNAMTSQYEYSGSITLNHLVQWTQQKKKNFQLF